MRREGRREERGHKATKPSVLRRKQGKPSEQNPKFMKKFKGYLRINHKQAQRGESPYVYGDPKPRSRREELNVAAEDVNIFAMNHPEWADTKDEFKKQRMAERDGLRGVYHRKSKQNASIIHNPFRIEDEFTSARYHRYSGVVKLNRSRQSRNFRDFYIDPTAMSVEHRSFKKILRRRPLL